ncbi:MAG TPA: O-antigen ligase family protein [Anaerolineae bacterium]|nr:O-antigen ligase family protein [Anaerolineae bacterium]
MLDLICTITAAALWYVAPQLGVWPLLLALLPWGGRFFYNQRLSRRTPFDLLFFLFLLTAVASIWSAFDTQAALAKFWVILAGILLFYSLINAQKEQTDTNRLLLGLTLFGTILTIYFLLTNDWSLYAYKFPRLAQIGALLQTPFPTLPGHRLHPNVVGGMLAMVLPFTTLITWWDEDQQQLLRPPRLPLLAAWLLLLLGLLLTFSRGAWLATAIAAALALLFTITYNIWPYHAHKLLAFLCALLVISTALLSFNTLPTLLDWWQNGPVIQDFRAEILDNSQALVADYPFIGSGLNNFMLVYASYAMLMHVGFTVHAHNIYLNVAIEQGFIAALLLVILWVLFFYHLSQINHKSSPQFTTLAAIFALVTIAIHGLVDDAFYGSRAVILLFVPLAFISPQWQPQPMTKEKLGYILISLAALIIITLGLHTRLRANWYANLAAIHQAKLELTHYQWPAIPMQDATRQAIDLTPIINTYQQSLHLNPNQPSANRRLGQIELSLGHYQTALDHLQRAHNARPNNTTQQLLGEAYAVNGDTTTATTLWQTVYNSHDQLELRRAWYDLIDASPQEAWISQTMSNNIQE